jgi:hypothetical protein
MTIFIDTATLTTKTTPSSVDVAAFVDSATLIALTTLTSIDALYVEANTLTVTTSLLEGDDLFVHPTGSWGPFDDDSGAL